MRTYSCCRSILRAISGALLLSLLSSTLVPVDAAPFIYRGRYLKGKKPASGKFDFQFLLFDAPTDGNQIGSAVIVEDVVVRAGNYNVELDLGDAIEQSYDLPCRWNSQGE